MLVLFLYCLLLWILQVNYSSPDQCTQELLHILKLTVKISSIWYDLLWTIRTPSWSFWKVYRFWFEQALRRVFGKSTDVWRWAVLMTGQTSSKSWLSYFTSQLSQEFQSIKKGGKTNKYILQVIQCTRVKSCIARFCGLHMKFPDGELPASRRPLN